MNYLNLLRKINLSSAVIKPATLLLCGRDISCEMKNAFNLKNSIKNFLKSHDHHNEVYMKLYNNVVIPVVSDYYSGLVIDLNTIHLCLKKKHIKFLN